MVPCVSLHQYFVCSVTAGLPDMINGWFLYAALVEVSLSSFPTPDILQTETDCLVLVVTVHSFLLHICVFGSAMPKIKCNINI